MDNVNFGFSRACSTFQVFVWCCCMVALAALLRGIVSTAWGVCSTLNFSFLYPLPIYSSSTPPDCSDDRRERLPVQQDQSNPASFPIFRFISARSAARAVLIRTHRAWRNFRSKVSSFVASKRRTLTNAFPKKIFPSLQAIHARCREWCYGKENEEVQ